MNFSRILIYFFLLILLGCQNKDNSGSSSSSISPLASFEGESTSTAEYNEEFSELYPDGDYCASIDYYNPNTGQQSRYTLTVEISGGELVLIHWPNGGWLDDSHFSPPSVESDGSCSFSSYDGKRYTIQIEEEGSCGNSSSTSEVEEEESDDEQLLENSEGLEEENEDIGLEGDDY